jgi:hypothetical protein
MTSFKSIKTTLNTIFILAFLSTGLSFLTSCNRVEVKKSPYELSNEEREWMTKFFGYIMFFEHGIYTLWGSKPMVQIGILNLNVTEEEIKAWEDSLTEEEKENCFQTVDPNFDEDWEKWVKIRDRFPIKRFIFAKSEIYSNDEFSQYYFVDIVKTALVIQENYKIFRDVVGFDFHPLEVVFELRNDKTPFWEKIKNSSSNSLIWGLLFGFGKENSQLFYWKFFDRPDGLADDFFDNLPYAGTNEGLKGFVDFTIDYLHIPGFISYFEDDDVVKKYQLETETIRHIYKGKDFLDVTLEKLTNYRRDPLIDFRQKRASLSLKTQIK